MELSGKTVHFSQANSTKKMSRLASGDASNFKLNGDKMIKEICK